MPRIKLTVAYDGTDYVGWQYQPNGISVQQRIEQAIEHLTGLGHRVYSAGRTDAGVHARGMVCHLITEKNLPDSAWREGVNRFLPQTIAIRDVEVVDETFDARFSARSKRYRYSILRDPIRSPGDRLTSWQVKHSLSLEDMQLAAEVLIGRHDFAAFRTSGCSAKTTIREVFSIDFIEEDLLLHIDVCGSGFLRNMVRMIVGTLVEIGRGKRPLEDMAKLLTASDPVAPALTAPGHGLCLMEVNY